MEIIIKEVNQLLETRNFGGFFGKALELGKWVYKQKAKNRVIIELKSLFASCYIKYNM